MALGSWIRRRWWWVAGTVLALALLLSLAVGGGAAVHPAFLGLFGLWALVTLTGGGWRLWRRLTWAVWVRLVLSYALIGITPIVLMAAMTVVAGYMSVGQYASVRFGVQIERNVIRLQDRLARALDEARFEKPEEISDRFDRLLASDTPFRIEMWMSRLDGAEIRSPEAGDAPFPEWLPMRKPTAVLWNGEIFFALAHRGADGREGVVLIALDDDGARRYNADNWVQVFFVPPGGDGQIVVGTETTVTSGGRDIDPVETWGPWPWNGELMDQPMVIWFRVFAPTVHDLSTGEELEESRIISLLRTSPAAVWRDFTASDYELNAELAAVLVAMAFACLMLYGIAFAAATTMILSITRAVARLSRGATAVRGGNLDHRIPSSSRDQLGALADDFNSMTSSVQQMLADVEEKERMVREFELAREIQSALLPPTHQRHATLEIAAAYRPAAEVGGDGFDVLPLSDDHLLVTVSDVAGHGLATGLLMGSLKAALSTLVAEGYRGIDLLSRTNRMLMDQSRERTMATLVAADIDRRAGTVDLTFAGHPPALLKTPEGGVAEVGAGSVPLGTKLCEPRSTRRDFPPGSRLMLFTDGLVEATDDQGVAFGFDRLGKVLGGCSDLDASAAAAAVLTALDRFKGRQHTEDDVTIVIVDHHPTS
jgi:serine phosphatase RsbU (regulator of sigma subunit)